jgi:hypothetical protein
MDPSKFQLERDIVDRFVRLLGYTQFSLTDPNAGQKADTGADVLLTLDGRRYGIQVTVYHSDEGMKPDQKGSNLRRQEAVHKASVNTYAMCGNPSPWTALTHRIADKAKRQSSPSAFDELILLVVSSVPELGAVVSTLLLDLALDLDRMNATLSPTLQLSSYSSAYLYNMMGKGGPPVYEWTRETAAWRRIPRKDEIGTRGPPGMSDVIDESFKDVHKERIYRTLEQREIKSQPPQLQFAFKVIIDWGWIGEDFCFFFEPGLLSALFTAPGQPLPMFISDFGSRHDIRIQLKEVDRSRFGSHSPYREVRYPEGPISRNSAWRR